MSDLGPILYNPALFMCARVVDDFEESREGATNKLEVLLRPSDKPDADGVCRGFGLSLDHPDVARLSKLVDALTAAEKMAVSGLEGIMRAHPLAAWMDSHRGVGAKTTARLLAEIHDPYWNDKYNRPRTKRELRRYCGLSPDDGSALVRHTEKSCKRADHKEVCNKWNNDARMRLWLIAQSCIYQKAGTTHYRTIYDETKQKYAGTLHEKPCVRCGPSGKPAQPGSPLSDGHIDGRGRHAIMQAVLNDLFDEAERIHQSFMREMAA